ncbi:MAG TPA: TlpA disulfide reductase family protein [Rhizomicrobium sp.]|nr:TlpA disulfide reductase family protein [Rhizomicrobium sp.]
MTRSRFILVLAALLAAVAGAAVVLYVIPQGKGTPKPPPALAALKLAENPALVANVGFTDMGGRKYSLQTYRGRYVLLNLWASWCAPCVKELPQLANLQRAIPAAQFAVVTVDVERNADKVAGKFLIEHNAAELPAFADPGMKLMAATATYGLPTTLLIDPQGREVARATGPADWDKPEAVAYFEKLSKGKSNQSSP